MRWWGIALVMFLVVLLALFAWETGVQTFTWGAVPCRILSFELRRLAQSDGTERFEPLIRYEHPGGVSERYRLKTARLDFPAAEELRRRYPPGAEVTGWADPRDPGRTVLERPPWWEVPMLASLLLMLVAALFHARILAAIEGWMGGGALSARARLDLRRVLLSLLLLSIGVPLTGFLLAWPAWQAWQARGWLPRQATVESSAIHQSSGGQHGPHYELEVRYRWPGGHSTIYSFANSIFLPPAQEAFPRVHPAGSLVTAWVAPDGQSAVLDRGWFPGVLESGLALAMLGGGLYYLSRRGPSHWLPPQQLVLRPAWPPALRLALWLAAGLFLLSWGLWLLAYIPTLWRYGHLDLVSPLYSLVATGGGAWCLGEAWRQRVRLATPQPEVRLLRRLQRGGVLQLTWSFAGSARDLGFLEFELEGREEWPFRAVVATIHGECSEVQWHTSVFARHVLGRVQASSAGRFEAPLPEVPMHSLETLHARIRWVLRLRTERETWEFPVCLNP